MRIWDKIRKHLCEACDILEIIMAIAVVIGILIATIAIFPGMVEFWHHRTEAGAFMEFLEVIFTVVIGIEFMKMLCKPNTSNIIEVLIFLMARHMIIQSTTAGEDLLSVISICILFVVRRFMMATKPVKQQKMPNIFLAMKMMQSAEFRKALIRYQQEKLDDHVAPQDEIKTDD